jgi:hypothetical protein
MEVDHDERVARGAEHTLCALRELKWIDLNGRRIG